MNVMVAQKAKIKVGCAAPALTVLSGPRSGHCASVLCSSHIALFFCVVAFQADIQRSKYVIYQIASDVGMFMLSCMFVEGIIQLSRMQLGIQVHAFCDRDQ